MELTSLWSSPRTILNAALRRVNSARDLAHRLGIVKKANNVRSLAVLATGESTCRRNLFRVIYPVSQRFQPALKIQLNRYARLL